MGSHRGVQQQARACVCVCGRECGVCCGPAESVGKLLSEKHPSGLCCAQALVLSANLPPGCCCVPHLKLLRPWLVIRAGGINRGSAGARLRNKGRLPTCCNPGLTQQTTVPPCGICLPTAASRSVSLYTSTPHPYPLNHIHRTLCCPHSVPLAPSLPLSCAHPSH